MKKIDYANDIAVLLRKQSKNPFNVAQARTDTENAGIFIAFYSETFEILKYNIFTKKLNILRTYNWSNINKITVDYFLCDTNLTFNFSSEKINVIVVNKGKDVVDAISRNIAIEIETLPRSFFQKIPGFRSGVKLKKNYYMYSVFKYSIVDSSTLEKFCKKGSG